MIKAHGLLVIPSVRLMKDLYHHVLTMSRVLFCVVTHQLQRFDVITLRLE